MGDPFLRFVFLTLPVSTEPTLNITVGEDHKRYRITRDQLFALNAQIADALLRGVVRNHPAAPQELQLCLDMSSTSQPSDQPTA
jgi:hypothetical protein